MDDFALICVYNDETILSKYLEKSLKSLPNTVDVHLVDNCNNRYNSMAQALNQTIRGVSAKWCIFAHQDIEFTLPDLEYFMLVANHLEKPGVVGVAGCKLGSPVVYTNIKHGPQLREAGAIISEDAIAVQTIDECFFMIKTEVIQKHPFDEKSCSSWHLYCVDRCLELYNHGFINYVIGVNMLHHSKAVSMNASYFDGVLNLFEKYNTGISEIYTTCGTWKESELSTIKRLLLKERIKEYLHWNKYRYST